MGAAEGEVAIDALADGVAHGEGLPEADGDGVSDRDRTEERDAEGDGDSDAADVREALVQGLVDESSEALGLDAVAQREATAELEAQTLAEAAAEDDPEAPREKLARDEALAVRPPEAEACAPVGDVLELALADPALPKALADWLKEAPALALLVAESPKASDGVASAELPEPTGDAEALNELDALLPSEAESAALGVPPPASAAAVALPSIDGENSGVDVAERAGVAEPDGESSPLALALPLALPLAPPEAVAAAVRDCDASAVALDEPAACVSLSADVTLMLALALLLPLPPAVALAATEPVAVAEPEAQSVGSAEAEDEPAEVRDSVAGRGEGVGELVAAALCVAGAEPVLVDDVLGRGGDAEADELGDALGGGEEEPEGSGEGEPRGVCVAEALAVGCGEDEAHAVAAGVEEAAREALPALPLAVAAPALALAAPPLTEEAALGEPAADAEGDCVAAALLVAQPEAECETADDVLADREGSCVDVPLGVAVSDAEPEAHALGDNDARALVEGAPAVGVTLLAALALLLALLQPDGVGGSVELPLLLPHALLLCVALDEGEPEPELCDEEVAEARCGEGEADGVAEDVSSAAGRDGVASIVALPARGEGVGWAALGLPLGLARLGVADAPRGGEGVPMTDALAEGVPVSAAGLLLAHAVPVGASTVEEAEACADAVPAALVLVLGIAEAAPEAVPAPPASAVPVAAPVKLCHAVAVTAELCEAQCVAGADALSVARALDDSEGCDVAEVLAAGLVDAVRALELVAEPLCGALALGMVEEVSGALGDGREEREPPSPVAEAEADASLLADVRTEADAVNEAESVALIDALPVAHPLGDSGAEALAGALALPPPPPSCGEPLAAAEREPPPALGVPDALCDGDSGALALAGADALEMALALREPAGALCVGAGGEGESDDEDVGESVPAALGMAEADSTAVPEDENVALVEGAGEAERVAAGLAEGGGVTDALEAGESVAVLEGIAPAVALTFDAEARAVPLMEGEAEAEGELRGLWDANELLLAVVEAEGERGALTAAAGLREGSGEDDKEGDL